MNNDTNMKKSFLLLNSNNEIPEKLLKDVRDSLSSYCEISNQIKNKSFFEYIKFSSHYDIFNKYENSEEHKNLYSYDSHGVKHADNVSIFSYYIAEKEGYSSKDITLILEAARYHDIGRTNDWEEGNHGYAGANKYETYYKKEMNLKDLQIVKFLISAHDLPKTSEIRILAIRLFENLTQREIDKLCDMANIIRDADALDRTRFNMYSRDFLNPKYLVNESAKEIIEVAQILNYKESKVQD